MRALVLNASFEPLCIVAGRRALLLTLNGKAETIHDSKDVVHAEKVSFVVPSVVRLLYYVKVPYNAGAALNRRAVFMRDGNRCQYCNAYADSIDHVIPRSKGGQHAWENVVAACRACNSRKRDRLLSETNFVLRNQPVQPRQRVWVADGLMQSTPEWEQYLGSGTSLSA